MNDQDTIAARKLAKSVATDFRAYRARGLSSDKAFTMILATIAQTMLKNIAALNVHVAKLEAESLSYEGVYSASRKE
jgi:hypothetical protein